MVDITGDLVEIGEDTVDTETDTADSRDTVDTDMADTEVDSVVTVAATEVTGTTRPQVNYPKRSCHANGEYLFSTFVLLNCTKVMYFSNII